MTVTYGKRKETKMIFYNKSLDHKFLDYGIQIPISKSRSEKCFDYLKEKFPEKVKETNYDIQTILKLLTCYLLVSVQLG